MFDRIRCEKELGFELEVDEDSGFLVEKGKQPTLNPPLTT